MSPDDARAQTLALLDELLGPSPPEGIRVRLWDGTLWPDETPGFATIALKHPGALRRMLLPPTQLGLAQAYLRDDFDMEGDVERLLEAALGAVGSLDKPSVRARAAWRLVRLPAARASGPQPTVRARLRGRRHSIERDRQAIRHHYDVSNEFYRLFLGERMVYSCAYFARPGMTLDEAQEAKLDLVCRKLRLKPGQKLLDVGCGWGGLVIHAAQRYGVDATGITLSERQAQEARERIAKAGLEGRARVLVKDYREVDEPEAYDAIASVGMFEHVGESMLPAYFAQACRLLKPRGAFLNHGIAVPGGKFGGDARSFIEQYVFPDGELVPIDATLRAAAGAGFEVRDVESLREHYAITLRHWVRNLEARRAEALAHVDEARYRVWRLYMAGSAGSFAAGRISVFQTLLSKPDSEGRSGLPMTREDWYAQSHSMTS